MAADESELKVKFGDGFVSVAIAGRGYPRLEAANLQTAPLWEQFAYLSAEAFEFAKQRTDAFYLKACPARMPVERIGLMELGEYKVPAIGFPMLGWLEREAEITGTTKAVGLIPNWRVISLRTCRRSTTTWTAGTITPVPGICGWSGARQISLISSCNCNRL